MKWKLQTQKNLVPHKPTMKSQLISNITHRKTKPTAPKYRGKTPRFFRDGYYTRVFYTEIMTSVKNQWVCVSVGAIVFSIDFSSLDCKNGRLGGGTALSKTSSFSLLSPFPFWESHSETFPHMGVWSDQLSQQILACRSSCNINKTQTNMSLIHSSTKTINYFRVGERPENKIQVYSLGYYALASISELQPCICSTNNWM